MYSRLSFSIHYIHTQTHTHTHVRTHLRTRTHQQTNTQIIRTTTKSTFHSKKNKNNNSNNSNNSKNNTPFRKKRTKRQRESYQEADAPNPDTDTPSISAKLSRAVHPYQGGSPAFTTFPRQVRIQRKVGHVALIDALQEAVHALTQV